MEIQRNYELCGARWLLIGLFLCGVPTTNHVLAQFTPHRITFVDKGPKIFAPGTPTYQSTLSTYHPKAIERRRSVGMNPLLTKDDQPIYAPYLEQLEQLDVTAICEIRWRNCIIADVDSLTASQLRTLPFIASVTSTSLVAYPQSINDCSPPIYGTSEDIHRLANTFALHDAGVYGLATRVCLIDNGFRWQGMSSLSHVDIVGTYDAIYNDSIVSNQPGDPGGQDGHGSLVLSAIGGWQQDSLIGIAPHASFLLAKSEDMRYERRIEEDLYCAAIEWAERNGADVISSSLGYYTFDAREEPMQYAWLDGHTTFASQAVNDAVARGVICITASGNGGPQDSTLIIPADADSVITVGASLRRGLSWPQTSMGPTADGRHKPDLAVLGANVRVQGTDGSFLNASGTSMATPQVAGLASLLRQLYPELPQWVIRNALYNSCVLTDPLDTAMGRGVPDVTQAARMLGDDHGAGIGPPSVIATPLGLQVVMACFASPDAAMFLTIKGIDNTNLCEYLGGMWYAHTIPTVDITADTLWAQLFSIKNTHQRFYPSDSTWFPIVRNEPYVACGARLPSEIVSVAEKSVAPSHIKPTARLAPSIVFNGTAALNILAAGVPHTITVVHTSTGSVASCPWSASSGSTRLDVSHLTSGHYLVVVQTKDDMTVLPMIVH